MLYGSEKFIDGNVYFTTELHSITAKIIDQIIIEKNIRGPKSRGLVSIGNNCSTKGHLTMIDNIYAVTVRWRKYYKCS